MSLEAYTGKISDLVDSNPTPTDPKSQGDDHLRGIKYTLKQSFPNFTGPVNSSNEAIDQAVNNGLGFCKNKLFNGEVTRINQRGFDGNWSTKNTWSSGNTIAQQELCYGYDMWAKASATDMLQPIEAGNFRPSTVHTISGLNMTTRQETSPASGNWVITVPQTARNVQVEEGVEATPFEIRPISFELAQCQRYFETDIGTAFVASSSTNPVAQLGAISFSVKKRAAPAMYVTSGFNVNISGVGTYAAGAFSFSSLSSTGSKATFSANPAPSVSGGCMVNDSGFGPFAASAVI